MKILYILNDTFKNGGTESVVLNYFYHLDKNDINIEFMIHTDLNEALHNKTYIELVQKGVKVYCVTPRKTSIARNRKEILKVMNENKYDIVHSHADAANALLLKYAKKCGVKIRISHCHSSAKRTNIDSLKGVLHSIFLECCRYYGRFVATNFVACSDVSAIWLFGKRNYRLGNVYILHNAIDTKEFAYNGRKRTEIRKALKIENDFVIGHVGRFTDEKNHKFMLEILKDLVKRNKKYKLMLIGSGSNMNDIIQQAKEWNLQDHIIFVGNSNKVMDLLNAFDMFIMPSKYEGLSVSLVEAQANGLSCLVTDSKFFSKESMLTDGVKFLPLGDANKWAQCILNCSGLRNKKSVEEITMAGYDIQHEAIALGNFYRKLYNSKL